MKFKDLKKRLKNYGVWIAILAVVAILFDLTPENYDLFEKLLGLLVTLGILSNPTTDNSGFGDDK